MGAFFGPIFAVVALVIILGYYLDDVLKQLKRIADALENKNKK